MTPKIVKRLLFLTSCVLCFKECVTRALPLAATGQEAAEAGALKPRPGIEVPPPEILRFMRRFGYLEPNPSDSEALYHESAIVEAVKNIQKYGALNQTGKLDNETLNLFTKPRCGVPDIEATPYYLLSSTQNPRGRKKRYVVGARTWSKRRITYFIANWSLKIPKTQIERDIARSLALWSRYSGLKFERVNDTSADIIVGFGSRYHGDNYPFDGPGNILAHAFYPYEMGSWGGDVHFDEDENWQENSTDLTNGVDFYAVAVHEIGHSLGLAHSPVYNSIMFPYYKGPEQSTLDYDDTMAMFEMYLSKQLEGDAGIDTFAEIPETTSRSFDSTTSPSSTQDSDLPSTCEGDCVSMDKHKIAFGTSPQPSYTTPLTSATQDTTRPLYPELSEIPNICEGHFDAVSVINGSVHIFKKEYVWKLTDRYTIMSGYPRSIYELFPFLPFDVKRIDSAYGRYDGATVFFVGPSFWVFRGSTAIENSPRPLSDFIGHGHTVTHVDAVMMWPKNNYTYIFSGSKFWRYNDQLQMLDFGYPKSINRWPGIPSNINAAATLSNGKTYFFKDNIYWLYNNNYVRPERGYPRRASTAWLSCPTPTKTPLRNFNTTVSFISFLSSSSILTFS